MAKKTPNSADVIEAYNTCDDDIKEYFSELIQLLEGSDFSYQTAIAYSFLKVEQASHRILYGGLVRIHRADTSLALNAVDKQHLGRHEFIALCGKIFDNQISPSTLSIIKSAEDTRDRVMHGKTVPDAEIRKAITVVLKYSSKLNDEVRKIAGFSPFGSMQGFKGRSKPMDTKTTEWLLKGIGFIKS